jgi:hypothetical protein
MAIEPEVLPAWVALLAPTTDAARAQVEREIKVIRHRHALLWREKPTSAVHPMSPERCEALLRGLSEFQCDERSGYRPVMHLEELGGEQ